jgi:hypothetical protein
MAFMLFPPLNFPARLRPALRSCWAVTCLSAGLLAAASPAAAQTNGNRLITVTAERQAESTSYTGRGSLNFVSYKLTVANVGGNVVNNIVVRATSRVLPATASDTDAGAWPASTVLAPYNSSSSAVCTVTTAVNQVSCAVGQLRPLGQGGTPVTYLVWFASPTRTGDPGFAEEINLQWSASYSDSSNGERIDSDAGIANAPTSIDAFGLLTNEFKSAVPLGGATLSTGSLNGDGLPTPQDPWTTTVVVPGAVADFKQARGTERSDGIIESSDLIDRRITELVIPDTNYAPNKIVITLRRDFSTIRKGSRISNSVIYYTKTIDGDPSLATDRAVVVLCTSVPENGPYIDATGVARPCIRSRAAAPAKKVVNGRSEGYWQWVIEAFENGRYIN